jgi:hypothetical protein
MASRTTPGRSALLGETKTDFDASSEEGKNVSVGKAILQRPILARGRLVKNPSRTREPLRRFPIWKLAWLRGRHIA